MNFIVLPLLAALILPQITMAQSPTKAAKPVTAGPQVTARLSPNKNYLSLNFKNLSTSKSFTYEVNYTSNTQEQGVYGQVTKVKTNILLRQMFLGTCSKKVCVPHKNIKNLTVTARFTLKNGKKTTRILTL